MQGRGAADVVANMMFLQAAPDGRVDTAEKVGRREGYPHGSGTGDSRDMSSKCEGLEGTQSSLRNSPLSLTHLDVTGLENSV